MVGSKMITIFCNQLGTVAICSLSVINELPTDSGIDLPDDDEEEEEEEEETDDFTTEFIAELFNDSDDEEEFEGFDVDDLDDD